MVQQPYVFVIGFNKTATTAIHHLFERSGYKSVHHHYGRVTKRMVKNLLKGNPVLKGFDKRFQVFSDLQFRNERVLIEGNSFFRQLDQDYPNSLFIYNYRDLDEWVQSRLNQQNAVSGMKPTVEFHKRLLNTQSDVKIVEHWVRGRLHYEAELRAYFEGSDRLLEIDIASPDFVEQLRNFTKMNLKPEHWQKHNVTKSRTS